MVITAGQVSIIVTIAIFLLGIIFAIIGVLLKKSIFEELTSTKQAVKEMGAIMHAEIIGLADKLTEFKEEVIKEYVRREELENNDSSHKEFLEGLGKVKERIAVLESENRSLKAWSYHYKAQQQRGEKGIM